MGQNGVYPRFHGVRRGENSPQNSKLSLFDRFCPLKHRLNADKRGDRKKKPKKQHGVSQEINRINANNSVQSKKKRTEFRSVRYFVML